MRSFYSTIHAILINILPFTTRFFFPSPLFPLFNKDRIAAMVIVNVSVKMRSENSTRQKLVSESLTNHYFFTKFNDFTDTHRLGLK